MSNDGGGGSGSGSENGVCQWRVEQATKEAEDNVVSVLYRHRHSLLARFEAKALERAAKDGNPNSLQTRGGWRHEAHGAITHSKISNEDWADVLSRELGVDGSVWHALRPMLGGQIEKEPGFINFRQQIRLIEKEYHRSGGEVAVRTKGSIAALYQDHASIKAMFGLIDTDQDGTINYHEFESVVNMLNKSLRQNSHRLLDARLLWSLLDRDNSGSVDFNEFAEGTRMVDSQTT